MESSLQFDDDARAYFSSRGLPYPTGFRWEICMGMLLWAISIPERRAVVKAVRALSRHHGVATFLKDAWKSLTMRMPARWNRG